jgi:hypothetical protein
MVLPCVRMNLYDSHDSHSTKPGIRRPQDTVIIDAEPESFGGVDTA